MKTRQRILIATAGAALWLLVFGFVMFATAVTREPGSQDVHADGIVVLTGGETRILEGARLLSEGRADRMLISGVNARTRREQLLKLSGLGEQKFSCCVDLGYSARDTVGNADEARLWAEEKRYDSLIVVTSSYHMPRSLAELARVLPGTRLIAHPVFPKSLQREAWWLHLTTTRVLIAEYLKFLPAAARFAAARLMRPWEGGSVAEAPESRRAKI
jgi:uncharacterized SAM-binding protein YcdF (DUF218 family)